MPRIEDLIEAASPYEDTLRGWTLGFGCDLGKIGVEVSRITHSATDFTFRRHEGPAEVATTGSTGPVSCWDGDMLRYVLDVRSRHVQLPDHVRHSPAALHHLISDDIIPRILSHERVATVHMSAVRIGPTAVAFCGRSGQGKSTLAAAMMRAGHGLLTDDCLTLTPEAESVIARGLSASLRVWPQTFEAMFGEDGIVPGEAGPPGKLRVDAGEGDAADACPLGAVYVLGQSQDGSDTVTIERVSPAEACGHLVRNSFGFDLWSADWKAWLIGSSAEIAARVPVFTLSYPRRFDRLPEVIEYLETRHMDGLAARAP